MLNHNQNLKTILIFCLITISQPAYSGSLYERFCNIKPTSFFKEFFCTYKWVFSSQRLLYDYEFRPEIAENLFTEENLDLDSNDSRIISSHVNKRSKNFFKNLYYRALNIRYKKKALILITRQKDYYIKDKKDTLINLTYENQNAETETGFIDFLKGMGGACLTSIIFGKIIRTCVPQISIKGLPLNDVAATISLFILPTIQFFNPLGQKDLEKIKKLDQVKKGSNFDEIYKKF